MRLEDDLARLATLSPAALRDAWAAAYGEEAPRLSPALLRMGIAYRWQEKILGGLSKRTAHRLASGKAPKPAITLSPGTQLVRSWNGRTLSVIVEEGGFLFEERRYTSLSAIARAVTGTAWSGPRFFGLKDQARG